VVVLLLGPGLAALVGMVFGVVSNSSQQATRALFLTVVWFYVLAAATLPARFLARGLGVAWFVGLEVIVVVAVLAAILRWTRRWTPWKMSLLLALSYSAFSGGVTFVVVLLGGMEFDGGAFALLSTLFLIGGLSWFWWRLGLHVFEEGMAREATAQAKSARG
jgi:hypothetical protein